jgi:hypothetical protein
MIRRIRPASGTIPPAVVVRMKGHPIADSTIDKEGFKNGGMTMNRIVVKGKVSRDGILHLSVPLGLEEADKEVQVTVQPLATRQPMTQEEWHAWVDSMAGTWQGDFERPPQGEYEVREPLS